MAPPSEPPDTIVRASTRRAQSAAPVQLSDAVAAGYNHDNTVTRLSSMKIEVRILDTKNLQTFTTPQVSGYSATRPVVLLDQMRSRPFVEEWLAVTTSYLQMPLEKYLPGLAVRVEYIQLSNDETRECPLYPSDTLHMRSSSPTQRWKDHLMYRSLAATFVIEYGNRTDDVTWLWEELLRHSSIFRGREESWTFSKSVEGSLQQAKIEQQQAHATDDLNLFPDSRNEALLRYYGQSVPNFRELFTSRLSPARAWAESRNPAHGTSSAARNTLVRQLHNDTTTRRAMPQNRLPLPNHSTYDLALPTGPLASPIGYMPGLGIGGITHNAQLLGTFTPPPHRIITPKEPVVSPKTTVSNQTRLGRSSTHRTLLPKGLGVVPTTYLPEQGRGGLPNSTQLPPVGRSSTNHLLPLTGPGVSSLSSIPNMGYFNSAHDLQLPTSGPSSISSNGASESQGQKRRGAQTTDSDSSDEEESKRQKTTPALSENIDDYLDNAATLRHGENRYMPARRAITKLPDCVVGNCSHKSCNEGTTRARCRRMIAEQKKQAENLAKNPNFVLETTQRGRSFRANRKMKATTTSQTSSSNESQLPIPTMTTTSQVMQAPSTSNSLPQTSSTTTPQRLIPTTGPFGQITLTSSNLDSLPATIPNTPQQPTAPQHLTPTTNSVGQAILAPNTLDSLPPVSWSSMQQPTTPTTLNPLDSFIHPPDITNSELNQAEAGEPMNSHQNDTIWPSNIDPALFSEESHNTDLSLENCVREGLTSYFQSA